MWLRFVSRPTNLTKILLNQNGFYSKQFLSTNSLSTKAKTKVLGGYQWNLKIPTDRIKSSTSVFHCASDNREKNHDQHSDGYSKFFISNFFTFSLCASAFTLVNFFSDSNSRRHILLAKELSKIDSNRDNKVISILREKQIELTSDVVQSSTETNLDTEEKAVEAGNFIDGLPIFSLEEVSKHNDPDNPELGVWVVYKAGVYDVSSFVKIHPGGSVILLAAGNSIEPFWEVYAQHKTEQVYEVLESFRIGNLREEDRLKASDLAKSSEIFEFVPKRDQSLTVHHEKPFNAETPPELLTQSYITSNEKFFIRNHLSVPDVDPNEYSLEIEGFGLNDGCTLTLDEIKTLFPKHTVTSVIQCAGNRRDEFNKIKEVKGIAWGVGAIGNAQWSGARLIDVLRHFNANLDHPSIKHVQFEGLDLDATSTPYGASVPADKALDPNAEFLLAYEMNGKTIPADHGYPIRLIAPGVVGARNVKWLGRIILSDEESSSHWQKNDYKSFPSNKYSATSEEFATAYAIQDLPIQSAVCSPKNGETVKPCFKQIDGQIVPVIEACGYAWSGGGRAVIRVDLSTDGGKTWTEAVLEQETPPKPTSHTYSWTLWKVELQLEKNDVNDKNQIEIICRAFDSSYNTQPSSTEQIWNFRGLLNNSYHRVNVKLPKPTGV